MRTILSIIASPLPPALGTKFRMYMLSATACLLVGILLPVLNGFSSSGAAAALFPILLAVILYAIGITYKAGIQRKGYQELTGEVTMHYHPLSFMPGRGRRPLAIVVSTADAMLYVPVTSRRMVPPAGSNVTVYIAADSRYYDNAEGVRHYDDIYGYAMLPEENLDA